MNKLNNTQSFNLQTPNPQLQTPIFKFQAPNSRLRICVLGTRGFPDVQGGVEKHCEHLYPLLAGKGCQVTVLGRKPYTGSESYEYKGVQIIPFPCPKSKFLEAFLHTFIGIFTAKRIGRDILHIHAIGPSLFVPLAKLLGMRVVMTYHGPEYKRAKWNWFAKLVLRLAELLACRNADAVIAVSKKDTESVERRFLRKVTAIPNGVTIPQVVESDGALKKYGLEKGKYILTVGRFVPEKAFHDLVAAFNKLQGKRIKEKGKNEDVNLKWRLVIVGDADHPDKYSQSLKDKAQQNKDIVLTGFLTGEPLQELYSHAGLFVLPSYYEGLPIVLLEAMSYGLSCIASDIPANKNVELDDERFFKAGNVSALAEKIKEFINKPLTPAEKQAQISVIEKRYNWDEIAERTMEVYREVAGSRLKG